jgi:hypothetical protein
MISPERDEVLETLRELSALCPEVRFGQLVVNLSYLARGMAHESIWDVEDDEFLRAARTQLETLRARQASATSKT